MDVESGDRAGTAQSTPRVSGQLWAEIPEYPGLPTDPDVPEEKATLAAGAPCARHARGCHTSQRGVVSRLGKGAYPLTPSSISGASEWACTATFGGQMEARSPWISSSSSPI